MATLTVQTVDRAGLVGDPTVAAAGGGDNWANTGAEIFVVKNGGGGSINVTLDIQSTVDGQAVTDRVVAVAAGVTKFMGPFPTANYNDGNGRMNVTYSGVTTVTVMVIKPTTT